MCFLLIYFSILDFIPKSYLSFYIPMFSKINGGFECKIPLFLAINTMFSHVLKKLSCSQSDVCVTLHSLCSTTVIVVVVVAAVYFHGSNMNNIEFQFTWQNDNDNDILIDEIYWFDLPALLMFVACTYIHCVSSLLFTYCYSLLAIERNSDKKKSSHFRSLYHIHLASFPMR